MGGRVHFTALGRVNINEDAAGVGLGEALDGLKDGALGGGEAAVLGQEEPDAEAVLAGDLGHRRRQGREHRE